jgi:hypothetical protein
MEVADLLMRGRLTHECIVVGFEDDRVLISPVLPLFSRWQVDRYRIRKPRGLTILENRIAEVSAAGGAK